MSDKYIINPLNGAWDTEVIYLDGSGKTRIIDYEIVALWLEVNNCKDVLSLDSLITVVDGTATYQAICRKTRPYRIVKDTTTGEAKRWTHHMRVKVPLSDLIDKKEQQ